MKRQRFHMRKCALVFVFNILLHITFLAIRSFIFCEIVDYTLKLLLCRTHQIFHVYHEFALFLPVVSDSCRNEVVDARLYVALQGDGG